MKKEDVKILNDLAKWLKDIVEAAKNDENFSVAWFEGTRHEDFSIVAGWLEGFDDYNTLLCTSKSEPKYALCVKIVVNEGPYAYADFDTLNMPVDSFGNVDDTCIAIEQEDDLNALAQFLYGEWERITDEHE